VDVKSTIAHITDRPEKRSKGFGSREGEFHHGLYQGDLKSQLMLMPDNPDKMFNIDTWSLAEGEGSSCGQDPMG